MNTPSTRAIAALALAALAGAAAAQTPSVEYRLIAASSSPGVPFSLPQGLSIRNFVPAGPGRVLISTANAQMFLSDGLTLAEVCRAGTQIPGQPEGTLWRGLMGNGNTIAIENGSIAFYASITLPGVGNANRIVAGNLASGGPMTVANAGLLVAATRTGLISLSPGAGELQVGPIGGPYTSIVPANFTPPGLAGTIRVWAPTPARLNSAGAAAGSGATTANESFGAVIDADGFHTVLATGKVIHTDRGDFTLRSSFGAVTPPMDDGSVVWSVSVEPADSITLIADRDGNGSVLPLPGDPAPGCTPGDVIDAAVAYAAAGNGQVVWGSLLNHDGAPAGSALFLRRNGRDRLILRSGTQVPGAPDGAVVPLFDPRESGFTSLAIDVNRRGDVAVLVNQFLISNSPGVAYLYNPAAGVVEFARLRLPLTLPPLSATLEAITPAFGTFTGAFVRNGYTSGGDDDRCSLLDDSGGFYFAGGLGAPFTTTFGAVARITSPGCRPDYNADGFLDFFDYIAFIDCFEGGACPNGKDADFNNDDFADFFDYVDAFERGC